MSNPMGGYAVMICAKCGNTINACICTGNTSNQAVRVIDTWHAQKTGNSPASISQRLVDALKDGSNYMQFKDVGEPIAPEPEDKATFTSGATRSEFKPPYGRMAGAILRPLAERYLLGHRKHELPKGNGYTYASANWRLALAARDVEFFRQCWTNITDHVLAEARGENDPDPGGNIGGAAWGLDVLAHVRQVDPELYDASRGLVDPRSLSAITTTSGGKDPRANTTDTVRLNVRRN